MVSLLTLFNRLLPFATPGTPLIQDLLHLAAICVLLYFAPQIQERFQRQNLQPQTEDVPRNQESLPPIDPESHQGLPGGAEAHAHAEEDFEVPAGQPDAGAGIENGPDHENANFDGPPGPADQPTIPTQRNVGAKKAKSLARRDQRRAYNEFMRSQGDAQRARDAQGAAERDAALAAEKDRRAAATAALEAKKAKERDVKREQERREREKEARRRDLVVSLVREELEQCQMCDLFKVAQMVGDDVDEEWVEKIVQASGTTGLKNDAMTMITGMGWAVRVTRDDMAELYRTAVEMDLGDEEGRISPEALGGLLEAILRERVASGE